MKSTVVDESLSIFHQRSWRFPLCTHHNYNQSSVPERIYLFLLQDTTEWEIYTNWLKAEKDLLQARVKSINSILGDITKQRELKLNILTRQ